jgi:hypothetical protein
MSGILVFDVNPIVNHKSRFLIWEIAMRPRAQTDVWGGEGLRFGLAHTETRPVNLRKRRKLREETAMRAADDFSVIRARMQELQRERPGRREPEPQRTTRADTLIIGASDPKAVQKDRITERNRLWMAQQR